MFCFLSKWKIVQINVITGMYWIIENSENSTTKYIMFKIQIKAIQALHLHYKTNKKQDLQFKNRKQIYII